jgi:hypothetical protein
MPKKKAPLRAKKHASATRLNVPMTPELLARIHAHAEKNKVKMASWARRTLEAALTKIHTGKPLRKELTDIRKVRRSATRQQTLGLEPAQHAADGG